jgi:hypothetical protein
MRDDHVRPAGLGHLRSQWVAQREAAMVDDELQV